MNKQSKESILILGGSGFIGSEILVQFIKKYNLVSVSRTPPNNKKILWIDTEEVFTEIGKNKIIKLKPINIIYTTFIAHKRYKNSSKFQYESFRVNIKLLQIILDLALKIKCKKFIYLSSAGVHGDYTLSNQIINEGSNLKPNNPYTKMKLESERLIKTLLEKSEVKYTIIRPCLVYGKNIKGNLFLLKKLINLAFVLPFKFYKNKRSFLGIDNLISFIQECLINSAANNKIFLITDKEQISLYALVSLISSAGFKRNFFIKPPRILINTLEKIFIFKKYYYKLYSDLRIDSSYARKELQWEQPKSQIVGLLSAFKYFEQNKVI